MKKKQQIALLSRLVYLNRDSENGFLVAAENVQNRGLKAMLKTCALERAEFVEALCDELRKKGAEPGTHVDLLAAVHRGWIGLTAAMRFEPTATERQVLRESLRGEQVALRTYERALSAGLPPSLHQLLEQQQTRIIAASDQIARLLGMSGDQLVVRLFDREDDLTQATARLVQAGLDASRFEAAKAVDMLRPYAAPHPRHTARETFLAGALLGVLPGVLVGLVVGLGLAMTAAAALVPVVASTLVGALVGAALLGFIGLIIGVATVEEDAYQYEDSLHNGLLLLKVWTSPERAAEASRIMYGVNAAARATTATR